MLCNEIFYSTFKLDMFAKQVKTWLTEPSNNTTVNGDTLAEASSRMVRVDETTPQLDAIFQQADVSSLEVPAKWSSRNEDCSEVAEVLGAISRLETATTGCELVVRHQADIPSATGPSRETWGLRVMQGRSLMDRTQELEKAWKDLSRRVEATFKQIDQSKDSGQTDQSKQSGDGGSQGQ